MAKKTLDPDDSHSKKEETVKEEKTEKQDEKPAKAIIKSESSLNMPKLVTAILVIGFIASIAASYGVQRYRDVYVIPPQKEKTFLFSTQPDFGPTRLRNLIVEHPDHPFMTFYEIGNPQEEPLQIFILGKNRAAPVPAKMLKHLEYGRPDAYRGGKFKFHHNYRYAEIEYVIHTNGNIKFYIHGMGERPDGDENMLYFTMGREHQKSISVRLEMKTYMFERKHFNTLENDDYDIDTLNDAWRKTTTNMFSVGQQQLPKAYLELVESAYAYVANSLNLKNSTSYVGTYENFDSDKFWYFIQPRFTVLKSLDEQVFALMTMSKLESEDTLRVLSSWINTANELGHMGNVIDKKKIVLGKIQAPLLFQLIKELLENKRFHDSFSKILDNLEYIAENTWKNSIGVKGLEEVKWLGGSSGIFGLEDATPAESSSFELLCLLGDMSRVMHQVRKKATDSDNSKWAQRYLDVEAAMTKYWDNNAKQYGDLVNGKITPGQSTHVPIILGLIKEDSTNLKQLLENLQQDPNFLPFGLQLSEERGVRVGTNYLLIQSLKKYSGLSGPSQELAHNMYSVLKNHLAAVIARANRVDKSFHERYDKNMQPLGTKGHPDGTLIFNIMASN